jgi:hypothetical protein
MGLVMDLFGDLWHFPFYADVWGTVTDWLMLVVTALTGYLVWQTLKSQLIVLRLQQGININDEIRLQKDISPKFRLSATNSINETDEGFRTFSFILLTNIANYEAKDIKVDFQKERPLTFGKWESPMKMPILVNTLMPNQSIHFTIVCEKKTNDVPFSEISAADSFLLVALDIYFSDLKDTRYKQELHYERMGTDPDNVHTMLTEPTYYI